MAAGPMLPVTTATTLAIQAQITARLGALTAVDVLHDSGWVTAWTDAEGHVALGIKPDGSVYARVSSDAVVPTAALDPALVARVLPTDASTQLITADSGWVTAWTDAEGHVALGIKPDGSVYARLSTDTTLPPGLLSTALASANTFPLSNIACWGDSLTYGGGGGGTTYPGVVATALGRTVYNGGVSGQTSDQIAARQGGLTVTVSVSGALVPASGSVSVTAKSTNILQASGAYTGTAVGTLAGVRGTMSTDASGNWTFTRDSGGYDMVCPDGTPFYPDTASDHERDTVVVWAGRNNPTALTQVRDNVLGMVARLTPLNKRVLVLSVVNTTSETYGSAGYNTVRDLNRELSDVLGDRFLDVRSYLVRRGLAEAGISATAQDNTDVAADCPPTSLRVDGLHFNAAGYTVVGNFVSRAIIARGW